MDYFTYSQWNHSFLKIQLIILPNLFQNLKNKAQELMIFQWNMTNTRQRVAMTLGM